MKKRLHLLTFIVAISLLLVFLSFEIVKDARAATQLEINQAIQDGLAWLATQQNPTYGYFGSGYVLANTATAVLAFANEGHFPGGGNTYSANVEKGLDYIFTRANKISIYPQTVGYLGRNDDPDTNGNGLGVFFNYHSLMYETGLVMQAIVASNTPDRIVTTGSCAGMKYKDVMEDMVDFIAWAQMDGGLGRGGWRYGYYNNAAGYSDNSVSQWPVLGLIAAEQWGIYAPQFVKDEMEHWVTYIQHPSGGSGYHTPSTYLNISKTGGLLVEFFYLGDDVTTPRVIKALNYINSRWTVGPYGTWYGNKGHPYAMFSVFKGLELFQVTDVPNAPANPDTPAGDWWGDYSDYLVNTQYHPGAGLGYWNGYSYWGRYLATPWYIVILQASVFPVSVDVVVPGASCDLTGYDVSVHYSVERFIANGTLSVYRDDVLYDTVTLTDFIGEATSVYNISPGELGPHTWKAVLDVTGGGITTQAEDTDETTVYETPQVAGIPDQVAPFTTFDLDDFQTCECADVEWSALGVPAGWTVTIDPDHVVTVDAPAGATEPATITFQALFHWPGVDCTGSDTAVFSPNRPPVAHPGKIYPEEKYYVDEGGSVILDGTQSYDPDGHELTYYAWDLDGDCVFETTGATVTFSAAALDGPDEVYVYLKVCDEYGACDIGQAEVEIVNVAPTVGPITAPLDPVQAGTPINASADFTDPGIADTHTADWDWGDSTTTAGTVSETGGSGSVADTHTYSEPGIYTIVLTVTDDDGGTGQSQYQYVVVYDPTVGFVTGGGWIDSPAGAYVPDPSLAGKATFGFVAKYKKGANIPIGQTEFQFRVAGLNFHSTSYDWLVVTGSNYARFKGIGTVNGEGSYNFMLWAGDSSPDTFRIKIWQEDESNNEIVIYDNGFDQAISSGSIVIHH